MGEIFTSPLIAPTYARRACTKVRELVDEEIKSGGDSFTVAGQGTTFLTIRYGVWGLTGLAGLIGACVGHRMGYDETVNHYGYLLAGTNALSMAYEIARPALKRLAPNLLNRL